MVDCRIRNCLSSSSQGYIPRPLTYVRAVKVEHLRTVAEAISVLINTARLSIIKTDRVHTELLQRVQFAWLGNAIVILVLPQSKRGEDGI